MAVGARLRPVLLARHPPPAGSGWAEPEPSPAGVFEELLPRGRARLTPAPDLETWGWGLPRVLAESDTETGDRVPLWGWSRLCNVPKRPRARSAVRPLCAKCS